MSSSEMSGATPGDTSGSIPVAPREIVDLVTRVLRVHGVDPGTAAETAGGVMRCQAHGHPAVEHVLAAVDDGSIGELRTPHEPQSPDVARIIAAHRRGIALASSTFRELERAASAFLVPEHVLDAVGDERPVD